MIRRVAPLLLVLAVLVSPFVRVPVAAAQEEHWKGSIKTPQIELPFIVHFTAAAGAADQWTATLDIPMQGVTGASLDDVTYTAKEIAFTLSMAGAVFKATIDDGGQTATGTLEQMGMTVPFELTRTTVEAIAEAKPKRPQTPQLPFPYESRDVTYRNEKDGITIAGTLTIPPGDGPFPAVVMITGSGPQDRNETLMEHQPFWVIADHLSRHGIAVLRSDDRGVGGTGGELMNATTENFALDALAGVAFLKTVDKIDDARIGVLGHSEGGIIGPFAASTSPDIAFVVMLAGTGLPGSEILALQTRLIIALDGSFTQQQLDDMIALHRAAMQAIADDRPREEQVSATIELMRAQGSTLDDEMLRAAAEQQVEGMSTPWFRGFIAHDPRPALRKVTCPVLALNGSLDMQVPPDENLAEIGKALKEAGNTDFSIIELQGLNHLFQHATTGSPTEYRTIEETFAPEALDVITAWINKRFGAKAAEPQEMMQVQ